MTRTFLRGRATDAQRALVGAEVREITFHEHHFGVECLDLGDRAAVHRVGIRSLARECAQHRPQLFLHHPFETATLRLAEVHVVHRGDRRERPAGRHLERLHRGREEHVRSEAVDRDLVFGAGLESAEAGEMVRPDGGELVVADPGDDLLPRLRHERHDDLVGGDRDDLRVADLYAHARLRRPNRPERRHSPRE